MKSGLFALGCRRHVELVLSQHLLAQMDTRHYLITEIFIIFK